jgi:hypothetical protein
LLLPPLYSYSLSLPSQRNLYFISLNGIKNFKW